MRFLVEVTLIKGNVDDMKNYIILTLVLALNNSIFPNDSRTVAGSSVEIIDNENTNIIMENETINITLHKDFYEVEVIFDFYNTGTAETISLGFPIKTIIQDFPDDKEWAKLQEFKSYINGNLLPEYSIKELSSKDDNTFYITATKWHVREVLFPGNSYTHSKVTYKAPYNQWGFEKNALYVYGTGRNWKDAIGRMTVYINHGDDILINSVNIGNNSLFKFSWEANGRYKYTAENIEPENQDQMIMVFIQPFDIYGEYNNEFGSWGDGWIWDRYFLYKNEQYIKLFTKNQIRLFINFFYAFHGYDFKNPLYKNYFQNLYSFQDYSDTKYKINQNFTENDFNNFEKKNIEYLLRIEKMIPPGP